MLGAEPTLVPGGGGIFDVTVDGVKVYSKFETGRFPDEAALVETLKARFRS